MDSPVRNLLMLGYLIEVWRCDEDLWVWCFEDGFLSLHLPVFHVGLVECDIRSQNQDNDSNHKQEL